MIPANPCRKSTIGKLRITLWILLFVLIMPLIPQAKRDEANNSYYDIIVMLDKSKSLEIDKRNSESTIIAANYLVQFLEMFQRNCRERVNISFITFGDTVIKSSPIQERITPIIEEKILSELSIGNEAKTDFIPPLTKAENIFSSCRPSKRLIIIFSDGYPDPSTSDKPAQNWMTNYFESPIFNNIIQKLSNLNAPIIVIGFDTSSLNDKKTENNKKFSIKELWEKVFKKNGNQGAFYSTTPENAIPNIHKVISKFLEIIPLEKIESPGPKMEISLEPFLENAFITILNKRKSQNIITAVQNGKTLLPDSQNENFIIYRVPHPTNKNLIIHSTNAENTSILISKRYPSFDLKLDRQTNHKYKDIPFFTVNEDTYITGTLSRNGTRLIEPGIAIFADQIELQRQKDGTYNLNLNSLNPTHEISQRTLHLHATYKGNPIPVRVSSPSLSYEKVISKSSTFSFLMVLVFISIIAVISLVLTLFGIIKPLKSSPEKKKLKIQKDIRKFIKKPSHRGKSHTFEDKIKFYKQVDSELLEIEKEYFSDIEADVCDLFSNILSAIDDEKSNFDRYLDIINCTNPASNVPINSLAKLICDNHWKTTSADQFIIELYEIIKRCKNPERILCFIKEHINDSYRGLIKVIETTLRESDEEIKRNLTNYLKEYQEAYELILTNSNTGYMGYQFYTTAIKIYNSIEKNPFQQIQLLEPLPFVNNQMEHWLHAEKLIYQPIRNGWASWEKLAALLAQLNATAKNSLIGPEKKIISQLLRKWQENLEMIPQHSLPLELRLSPSLEIDEDMVNDQGYSAFQITINNHSNFHAFDVKLNIIENGESTSIEIGTVKSKKDKISEKIKVKDFANTKIYFSHLYHDRSDSTKPPGQQHYQERQRQFPAPTELDSPINLDQPFNPFEPYYPGNIFVGREAIINQIEESIFRDSLPLLLILGMRRAGKTSLINYLMATYRDEHPKRARCIKFPSSVFDRKLAWTNEEFLGVIARSILRDMAMTDMPTDLLMDSIQGNLDESRFLDYIKKLKKNLNGQRLLIFFDDADYFEKKIKFGFDKLFPKLQELLNILKKTKDLNIHFIFLGCTNILGNGWEEDKDVLKKSLALNPLSRADVSTIAHCGETDFQFNELALEYLWRLTGGHPALTQYICNCVRFDYSNNGTERTISLPIIQKTIKNLVSNKDFRNYCWYIVRFSLPREEIEILSEILDAIDTTTQQGPLYFEWIGRISSLQRYRFISPIPSLPNRIFLEVGVYKLFIDRAFILKQSIRDIL